MRLYPRVSERQRYRKLAQEEVLFHEEPSRRNQLFGWQNIRCCLILAVGITVGILTSGVIRQKTTIYSDSTVASIGCTNPSLRREWRSLSTIERQDYIDAVKCLAKQPSKLRTNGTLYDDFPWTHRWYGDLSHNSALFLAWHRYFIHIYEMALQRDCGYQGYLVYWDWSLDSEDLTNSPVWDDHSGFGGNGDLSGDRTVGNGSCVRDGPFEGLHLLFYDDIVKPHCLSRGFFDGHLEGKLPGSKVSSEVINEILTKQDFETFFLALEHGPHNAIANGIRGEFLEFYAPGDPVFFLHHVQLDRLWWLWQRRDPWRRQYAYTGRANKYTNESASLDDLITTGELSADIRAGDVLNTATLPFCYIY